VWVRSNTWQDERPAATSLFRSFHFSTNLATGNRKFSESVQLQPVVWSFAVGFSSVSVIFSVQWTGPANTTITCTVREHYVLCHSGGHRDQGLHLRVPFDTGIHKGKESGGHHLYDKKQAIACTVIYLQCRKIMKWNGWVSEWYVSYFILPTLCHSP